MLRLWKELAIGKSMLKNILRIFFLPFGLINGLFRLANDHARDLVNRRSFPGATIDDGSCFTKDSTVGMHSRIMSGAIINHSHIGNYTYCNRNVIIQNTTIGNYCSIANEVMIGLGKHPINNFSTSPLFYRKNNPLKLKIVDKNSDFNEYQPIIIESDVWIGAKAVIMDGVKIRHGAIVAAGAIVTKDVPAYAIVGGVPAKIIKYRFTDDKIKELLSSNWWNLPAEESLKRMSSLNNASL